jgi:hypothetical protein
MLAAAQYFSDAAKAPLLLIFNPFLFSVSEGFLLFSARYLPHSFSVQAKTCGEGFRLV